MGIFFPDLSSTCDLDGKHVDPPEFCTLTFVTQPAEVLENKQDVWEGRSNFIVRGPSLVYFGKSVSRWCYAKFPISIFWVGFNTGSLILFFFLLFSLLSKLYDTVIILMAICLVCRLNLFLMILLKVIVARPALPAVSY